MKTLRRTLAWLRKYSDINLSRLPEALRKRILKFRIMRFIIMIAAGAWTIIPNMPTLIIGGFGLVCLFILTSIIEPKLDKDLKLNKEMNELELNKKIKMDK